MKDMREYEIALSFAGEDREYVDQVAAALKNAGITVFYDRYEQIDLWGKDLYTHLRAVYQHQARFTVMFISQHYAKKLWTNHERESAQARAFTESNEYILPVRFDDTEVSGILPTTGYLDLRQMTPAALASAIANKLGYNIEGPEGAEGDKIDEPFIAPHDGPVIVWRLPRGFLHMEEIVPEPYESWSVSIEHYGYDGEDRYGTHYHASYGRAWDEVGGMETQYRKLQLPLADWPFATGALKLARDIRDGRIVVDVHGKLTRNGRPFRLDDDRVGIYPSGTVPRQQVPRQYVGLQITGPVRDIIAEVDDIVAPEWRRMNPPPEDLLKTARGIRRRARIEIGRLFESEHPARINVEEIIDEFSRSWNESDAMTWLRELSQSLREASAEIRKNYEPESGVD